MKQSPLEGSCAEELCDKHGVYNNVHRFLSSPYNDSSSAPWAGREEPGSTQSVHKYCIGPIKVGKHSCWTLLQWYRPLQGPHRVAGGHQKSYPEVISQGFHHSTARSTPSEQEGSRSTPFLSQRHKSRSQTENSSAAIRISNCNSHPQALLVDRWQEWCSLQPSHSLSSSTLHSTSLRDSRLYSLRNKDPMTMPPAFKVCQNRPAMSA